MISLTLRTTTAFRLDTAKVRIGNDENRGKHVVDYTLIITTIGTEKSTIFNKLSQAATKREEFGKQRNVLKTTDKLLHHALDEEKLTKKKASETQKDQYSRHMITNDFTGAGIFKSLSDTGNVFILIDELDGTKNQIFLVLILKLDLIHCVDSYRKTRADGHVLYQNLILHFLQLVMVRLAKSIDQTACVTAELSHIELTMDLLNQFINSHDFNTFGTISFEIYCQIVDFIQNLYPPGNNTIIKISAKTVESAIYCMDISMIKYLNQFNIDSTCTAAILELPMHPPHTLKTGTNPSISQDEHYSGRKQPCTIPQTAVTVRITTVYGP
ncbi:unnamed protein product [Rotaria socialis]|uniref:Uncharacterized protein n=1 Tax=Rotaria socialis TaxID=392032 RepID=A0A820SU18_9BILA|nr:unnamed protein product [Rotaria socialis]CAF4463966.1 unnamed protein product [Rotaria socialis]CAF4497226.1 unnamed protein product [Rotaria socialis]CAF4886658.1 unnamed protein product [Rotaria socialis]